MVSQRLLISNLENVGVKHPILEVPLGPMNLKSVIKPAFHYDINKSYGHVLCQQTLQMYSISKVSVKTIELVR